MKKLHILWSNDNLHTSQFLVMFYSTQSKINHHWDDVTVILWGSPVKFVTENKIIQEELVIAMQAGVKFSACVSCARKFGVVSKLEELGIEVEPWTEPFTDLVKNNAPIVYA
ncbi:MAG: DsrE family protein [Defluviitaleaceae bacterium]|nr:DsrE family protein [Defluviitaleaceae bacterium]